MSASPQRQSEATGLSSLCFISLSPLVPGRPRPSLLCERETNPGPAPGRDSGPSLGGAEAWRRGGDGVVNEPQNQTGGVFIYRWGGCREDDDDKSSVIPGPFMISLAKHFEKKRPPPQETSQTQQVLGRVLGSGSGPVLFSACPDVPQNLGFKPTFRGFSRLLNVPLR